MGLARGESDRLYSVAPNPPGISLGINPSYNAAEWLSEEPRTVRVKE